MIIFSIRSQKLMNRPDGYQGDGYQGAHRRENMVHPENE